MTQLVEVRDKENGRRYQIGEAPLVKRHVLLADLRSMANRGEIASAWAWVERGGMVYVKVERLREPRSPVPWYIAGAASAMGLMVGIGVMLWHSRYIWMALAGVALLVAGIVKLLGNHGAGCAGLHCVGCKG